MKTSREVKVRNTFVRLGFCCTERRCIPELTGLFCELNLQAVSLPDLKITMYRRFLRQFAVFVKGEDACTLFVGLFFC